MNKKLSIPSNYVLIKPDLDYTSYQIQGRETGILNSFESTTVGERASVSGVVIAVPQKLNYHGDRMQKLKRIGFGGPENVQREADALKQFSVLYKVPIEIQIGQRVLFFYKNQIDCYRQGRVITDDEDGRDLLIVKYDTLNAIEFDKDVLYPLNGFIFIEKLVEKKHKKTAAGIDLLDQTHMGMKLKKPLSLARIVEVGCLCEGYVEFPGISDDRKELKAGDYIYYDERHSRNLQFETHQTHKTARSILSRKNIHAVVLNPDELELV